MNWKIRYGNIEKAEYLEVGKTYFVKEPLTGAEYEGKITQKDYTIYITFEKLDGSFIGMSDYSFKTLNKFIMDKTWIIKLKY